MNDTRQNHLRSTAVLWCLSTSIQRIVGSTLTATCDRAAFSEYRSQKFWARCFLYSWRGWLALFVKANMYDISPLLISFASTLWMNDILQAGPLRQIPEHLYCHPRHTVAMQPRCRCCDGRCDGGSDGVVSAVLLVPMPVATSSR